MNRGASHLAVLLIAALALVLISEYALSVQSDGGYEGYLLPADAGWVEYGVGFLGDYVSVADGVMTYDGTIKPAPGACGMALAQVPQFETAGTIEYRLRCRSIGGDSHKWYQYFMTLAFRNPRYAIYDLPGHTEFSNDPLLRTIIGKPEQTANVKPPTTTMQWAANEWVTIRHIFKNVAKGHVHVESWISCPGGEKKFIDVTQKQAGFGTPGIFWLQVMSKTRKPTFPI